MGPNRYAQGEQDSLPHGGMERALEEERRRRAELERQVRDLGEESRQLRRQAEESERRARLREGLKERGVRKTQLAMRLIEPDVRRGEDGELFGEWEGARVPLEEYLNTFVRENPEFLPPRIPGGSGATGGGGSELTRSGFDLDSIRPGMSPADTRQAWSEVARLVGATDPDARRGE
jgi:hypothetical protein